MNLVERALQPEVVNLCWRRLRVEHTPWSPQVSRDQLEHALMRHILELIDEVRAGKYRPAPLRQFTVRKADGKLRVISAQYLRDKLLQRAMLEVLTERAEATFHEDSFAYRPGRNVDQAVRRTRERIRCGLYWLADADIRQFFDRIPHHPLTKGLKSWLRDAEAHRLFELWLAQGKHPSSLLGKRRGVPQGAIVSPLLCNLYLHAFDESLDRANIPFVRYADDFLLFTRSSAEAEAARELAAKALAKLDLELHPEKTRIVKSSPKVLFLGVALPSVPNDAEKSKAC